MGSDVLNDLKVVEGGAVAFPADLLYVVVEVEDAENVRRLDLLFVLLPLRVVAEDHPVQKLEVPCEGALSAAFGAHNNKTRLFVLRPLVHHHHLCPLLQHTLLELAPGGSCRHHRGWRRRHESS